MKSFNEATWPFLKISLSGRFLKIGFIRLALDLRQVRKPVSRAHCLSGLHEHRNLVGASRSDLKKPGLEHLKPVLKTYRSDLARSLSKVKNELGPT